MKTQDEAPVRMLICCGPYTASDNLDYEPFVAFLEEVQREQPDVVLLIGPFMDSNHSAFKNGRANLSDDHLEFTAPYDTYFFHEISALLEELFAQTESLRTQFVVVPSTTDAVGEPVFPQPPFKNGEMQGVDLDGAENFAFQTLGFDRLNMDGDKQRVICVSNPCTIKINEVVVGITSTDTLFHISSDETNGNLEVGSRMTRIAQHLLEQRSYYPVFPPHKAINLDLKHLDEVAMPCQPDILIAPSKLSCFAKKVLQNTLVINPGYLTKGTQGGSFARVEIQPFPRNSLEDVDVNVELDHAVPGRACVDVKRI